VLEKGLIVEQGSHATLLRQGSRYAALWHSQSDERFGAIAAGEPA
jgi:ABC-type multidrug transport system fused ATPase/permease subunit